MKRLFLAVLMTVMTTPLFAVGVLRLDAQKGGERVATAGFQSTTKVQRSYPYATVTVYSTGTSVLTTLYTNAALTILKGCNPCTADSNGHFEAYIGAATEQVDVVISANAQSGSFTTFQNTYVLVNSVGGTYVLASELNNAYLRLDTSNDPLTGTLSGDKANFSTATGAAITGTSTENSGSAFGVEGIATNANGFGVYGVNNLGSGGGGGVLGTCSVTLCFAASFLNSAAANGVFPQDAYGLQAQSVTGTSIMAKTQVSNTSPTYAARNNVSGLPANRRAFEVQTSDDGLTINRLWYVDYEGDETANSVTSANAVTGGSFTGPASAAASFPNGLTTATINGSGGLTVVPNGNTKFSGATGNTFELNTKGSSGVSHSMVTYLTAGSEDGANYDGQIQFNMLEKLNAGIGFGTTYRGWSAASSSNTGVVPGDHIFTFSQVSRSGAAQVSTPVYTIDPTTFLFSHLYALSAGTTITAGTGITSTTGNITATAGSINAGTNLTVGSKLTSYNTITTAGLGQPVIVKSSHATGQNTGGATVAGPAIGAANSQFQICWSTLITTSASVSSSLRGTVNWNPGTGAKSSSYWVDAEAGTTGTTADVSNTVGSERGNCFVASIASASPTFSFAYSSVGGTAMVFEFHFTVIRLN